MGCKEVRWDGVGGEFEDEDVAEALDFAARNLDDRILPLEAA